MAMMSSNNFHWRLVDTCLEVSLSQAICTPDVEHMTRGLPSLAGTSVSETKQQQSSSDVERPTKRMKATTAIVEEKTSDLLWESATRVRIFISKELLSVFDGDPNLDLAFLDQAMQAIGLHAPSLNHCALLAAPYHHNLVEQNVDRHFYFPAGPLATLLQRATKLKTLDVVGVGVLHRSEEELTRIRGILRAHSLEELACTIDVKYSSSCPKLKLRQAAWTSSLLCWQRLKYLHLEGPSYLLNSVHGPQSLTNLGLSSISFLRLDVVVDPLLLQALSKLISACANLSHLSLGLSTSVGCRNLTADLTMMKQLACVVGKSRMDILRIRFDSQLLKDIGMTKCWTDMLKENFTITQFQATIFTNNVERRNPEEETTSKIPDQFQKDIQAFVQMNSMARKRVFSPYFELDTITNVGWARSLHEISASQLPAEHKITCLYLHIRQRPAEIAGQLLKQYDVYDTCREESVATTCDMNKFTGLIRSERRFYDLTYELVSLQERLANFQRSIVDTNDKRMKGLAVVARIKQVASGPGGHTLTPTLARLYDKASRLMVCLEHHTGTVEESLGMFRTGDGLKTLTGELMQLKTLLRKSFSMLEEIGTAS